MRTRTIAIMALVVASIVTIVLISESFVSYAASLTGRQMQEILQRRIVGYGIPILVLQFISLIAVFAADDNSVLRKSSGPKP